MTLWAHRHPRPERLVRMLCDRLAATWPDDPFARVSIVVGSRGMERWLRGELATRHGSVAGVDFVFPGRAFFSTTQAIFAAAGIGAEANEDDDGAWTGSRLVMRVLRALRMRVGEPRFARVARYLGDVDDAAAAGAAVGTRELAFATEVAAVIERLQYDRPDIALSWASGSSLGGDDEAANKASANVDDEHEDHPWLARIVADLAADTDIAPSPAARLAKLRAVAPTSGHPPLFVFGLSSLRSGDMLRIEALAPHVDIHLFALVPSTAWWADIRSRDDQRRALRQARSYGEREELLARLGRDNPLLSANGAPSRDLQVWLEEVGYQSVDDEADVAAGAEDGDGDGAFGPAAPTRLALLHRWLDEAGDALAAPSTANVDCSDDAPGALPSIELHACHGALRQCEALRDELLRRFAHDETLEPRHVLVMTPDLATYAPLLAAVLGRVDDGVPAIPVHIADLGVRDTNAVAEVLLDVLALVEERVGATALLDLLGHEPVRTRFAIDDDDLGALRDLVVASGLRWAWDAADRARHDQPALDQNTVRFALERLALGVLMPDPGAFDVLPAQHGLGPAAPVDLPTRDQAARFGTLAAVCDTLERSLSALRTPAPPAVWRERLQALLDALCAVPDERAWQRLQVTTTVAELLPDEEPSGASAPAAPLSLSAAAVAALLANAFALPRSGDRPATGAVTVCAMEPMRSVPFRVVAMVGMDDGAFPRTSSPRAWDPFARPAPGEHDRRILDRHLFLESILCARDALLIFGRGFESARGQPVPMSVVVEELRELLDDAPQEAARKAPSPATGDAVGASSRALVRRHPLQPWSPRAFADAERLPFGKGNVDAACARGQPARAGGLAATSPDAPWPHEHAPPGTVTAHALARALENAPACLLEHALDVHLGSRDVDVEDREPIELGNLASWRVRDDLLDFARVHDDDIETTQVLDRHRADGSLPLQAGGEAVLVGALASVNDVVRRTRGLGHINATAPMLRCAAGGTEPIVVTAAVPEVRLDPLERHRHVWPTASKSAGDKRLLEAWIALLVAVVAGEPVDAAHLVDINKETRLAAPTVEQARAYLDAVVDIWRRARRTPVPLVTRFSRALADTARKFPDAAAEAVVARSMKSWFNDDGFRQEPDPAAEALYGDFGEDDLVARAGTFVAHAVAVWEPLLAHMVQQKKPATAEPPTTTTTTATATETAKPGTDAGVDA